MMAAGLKRVGYELSRQLPRRHGPSANRTCRRFLVGLSHSQPEAGAGRERERETRRRARPPARPPGRGTQRRAWGLARPFGLVAGGGLLATVVLLLWEHDGGAGGASEAGAGAVDDRDPAVPRFRLSDVREHGVDSRQPWVTYEDKVYDISDWVAAHPGGDVILRAAGGAIEPYWDIFAIHKQKHVREVLEQYLIGYIDQADLVDGRPPAEQIEDPFLDDPARDGRLITHTLKPCNAETPREELDGDFHTPNELFYVRNHMWVPLVGADRGDDHLLSVELPDGESRQYTLAELKARFPVHRVTAALQCSGNRRRDMTRHAGKTNGLQWEVGAIGNAEWEGVRLSDVLADAGLKVRPASALTQASASASASAPDPAGDPAGHGGGGGVVVDASTHHVQFSGLEAYGASIPLSKALDPCGDVLLAFAMNGQPLPRDHGFPLRVVVPGHVAARWVKWLTKVVVADEESHSQWQRRDYKSFGPNAGAQPDWDSAPAIQELPVTSAITRIWASGKTGNETETGTEMLPAITMQGYAYSGGGRRITRVDVSLDGGRTWDQAVLLDGGASPGRRGPKGTKSWAWTRWRYRGQLRGLEDREAAEEEKCTTLVVKATDESYNTQPECHAGIYNVRGNLANAWHRVRICTRCMRNGSGVTWFAPDDNGPGLMLQNEAEAARTEKGTREGKHDDGHT